MTACTLLCLRQISDELFEPHLHPAIAVFGCAFQLEALQFESQSVAVPVRLAGASILGLFAFASLSAMAGSISDVIRTRAGKVAGVAVDEGGDKVYVFKGVPYAAPPVGELRWKAPQPVQAWDGVREAKQWSNQCAQRAGSSMGEPGSISEDCHLRIGQTLAVKKGVKESYVAPAQVARQTENR
jgi:hypothetical protein